MDDTTLERFLEFSDEDIAANRAGRLSRGQVDGLRWSGVWRLVVGTPILIGAAVFALLAGNALLTINGIFFAGLGLYLTWRGFAYLVDAADGAVAYMTGPIRRKVVQHKGGVTYYAAIGPVNRSITPFAYEALPEGLSCHLYYAPGGRSLLSAELASDVQPKPAHPFGPDAAHVWDRLRWSWVLMTIGVFGSLVGAHDIAAAHPAHAITVGGTIADYVETHGKTTSRYLYLGSDPNAYTPQREDTYDPPLPLFATLIGREVVLYIDEGTRNVIALNDGEQLHAADWYLHPEHETLFGAVNGAISAALSVIAFLVGIGLLVFGRRRAAKAAAADSSAPRPLYAPPSVRPIGANRPAALLVAAIGLTVALVLAIGIYR